MPKNYIYDEKEINTIWMEEIAEQYPDEDHIKKFQLTTPEQRRGLFMSFINRMGKKGWRLVNPIAAVLGDGSYHVFEKEGYGKGKTAVTK